MECGSETLSHLSFISFNRGQRTRCCRRLQGALSLQYFILMGPGGVPGVTGEERWTRRLWGRAEDEEERRVKHRKKEAGENIPKVIKTNNEAERCHPTFSVCTSCASVSSQAAWKTMVKRLLLYLLVLNWPEFKFHYKKGNKFLCLLKAKSLHLEVKQTSLISRNKQTLPQEDSESFHDKSSK